MKILIILLAFSCQSFGTPKQPCIAPDPCCQDCIKRAQLCDWRHDTLSQESQCFIHERQCIKRCQSQRERMSIKGLPADSSQQLSRFDEPNPAPMPNDSDE